MAMACQLDQAAVKNSDSTPAEVVCETCVGAVGEVSHHCDSCLANFCDRCAASHGKRSAGGETSFHQVEKGVCRYDQELELCPADGQKMAFYCQTCRVRLCPECELDKKKHVLHVVVSLTRQLGLEKEKLLDKLDDVTTKTETISHMPDHVKSISTQIELKWLERKELIRQEFASLFETLTTQQHKLLADMDEEVKKSLDRLNQLQQDHDAVMSNTCQLSDECILAVQNLPRNQFMNSYPQFLESVKQLEHRVERMQSAEDQMPAFLKVPFSLYKEKLHLHNSLQLSAFNLQGIRAREHHRFVPYDRLKEELSVNMLLDTPLDTDLPPSSTLRYSVDIYYGSKQNKKAVWSSKKPVRAMDTIINRGSYTLPLSPGCLYMVKIRPVLTCTTHLEEQTAEGRVISIVIITGVAFSAEPVMAAGDSHMAVPDTHSLLNCTFESRGEDDMSCFNIAAVGNKNNSSNRVRGQSRNRQGKTYATTSKPPLVDPLVSPSVLNGRARAVPSSHGEHIPTQAGYKALVPMAPIDLAFPVPAPAAGGTLCTQMRYVSDCCCFEEARLVEDNTLQVS